MTAKEKLQELLPLISEDQAARLVEQIREDQEDLEALRQGASEIERGETVPWEALKAELNLKD